MDDRAQHDEIACRTNLMLEYQQVLNTVCKYLGLTGGNGLPAPDYMIYGELEKRLMPGGYEWPRYEDGEPVQIGNEFIDYGGFVQKVKRIYFTKDGYCLISEIETCYLRRYGETVKRPIVPAADDKPLKVGQTVYAKNYGYVKCTVLSFEWIVDGWLVEVENENGHKFRQTPDEFTHQRPVLDIDHMVIKDGDTVWDVETGHEYKVDKVNGCIITIDGNDYSSMNNGAYYLRMYPSYRIIKLTHQRPALDAQGTLIKVDDTVWHIVVFNRTPNPSMRVVEISNTNGVNWVSAEDDNGNKMNAPAEQFTHIKPEESDTWERVEADCSKADIEYCNEHGLLDPSCNADEGEAAERHCIDCGCTCGEKMARDLVRRCKALSKRDK